MKQLVILALLVLAPLLPATDADALLGPCVKVEGMHEGGQGSGVVIAHEGKVSYVVTNEHVASGSGEWWVKVPKRKDGGKRVLLTWYAADVVALDEGRDVAVLRTRVRITGVKPARALQGSLELLEAVWAVGCPDGTNPIPVRGNVASLDHHVPKYRPHVKWILVTAPTWPGMSGGGLFVKRGDEFYYAGMPSGVHVGAWGQRITHLNLVISLEDIRAALKEMELSRLLQ